MSWGRRNVRRRNGGRHRLPPNELGRPRTPPVSWGRRNGGVVGLTPPNKLGQPTTPPMSRGHPKRYKLYIYIYSSKVNTENLKKMRLKCYHL